MANWYGASRSNYFLVKDREAFNKAMDDLDIEVWEDYGGNTGRVAIGSKAEDGGWPTSRWNDEIEEDEEVTVADIVAGHLADGEIAVLMCAGHEKLRYISGYAQAVHSDGRRIDICLHDIYARAEAEFGKRPTNASY